MPKNNNEKQVGGTHYDNGTNQVQHWDWARSLFGLEYAATKYIGRHAKKDKFKDLQKAEHYLHKMMEVYYPEEWAAKQKEAAVPTAILCERNHLELGSVVLDANGFRWMFGSEDGKPVFQPLDGQRR